MPAPDTRYSITGRFADSDSGDGISDLQVVAFDYDFGRPGQPLGDVTTGPDGSFEITFQQSDAGSRSEGAPEPYVLAFASDRRLVYQSPWVRLSEEHAHDLGTIELLPSDYAEGASYAPEEMHEEPGATTGDAPRPGDPSDRPGTARYHGSKSRDLLAPRSEFYRGPFGRLFRELPAWMPPGHTEREKIQVLRDLAAVMTEPEGSGSNPNLDNPSIPAAYTYFGQFIDHDITFDPGSSLQKQNDPERLHNFRTPRFDLDNLYGEGPDDEPFLYDRTARNRFVLGKGRNQGSTPDAEIDLCSLPKTDEDDLPRNEQGTALIGDPRNDENIIVAQLQLAFLKFHNAVMDHVEDEEHLTGRAAFERARNLVRWHYQWVVLHDFLTRIVGRDLVDDILAYQPPTDAGYTCGSPYDFDLRFYAWKESPYMPVEFSVAAYRLGHSMIRQQYDLNRIVRGVPIFRPPSTNPGPLADLRGGRPLPGFWTLDWRHFLELDEEVDPQQTRRLDTRLSRSLLAIPAGPGGENALAFLNLLRGFRMGLPSGQAVARAMGAARVYTNDELDLDARFGHEAPLWYYILKEADLEHDGEQLGTVGGRIVAEVFIGLAKGDPNSFFNVDPMWGPETASGGQPLIEPLGNRLELRDLLRFAGLDGDPFPE